MLTTDVSVLDDVFHVMRTKGLEYKHDGPKNNIIVKNCPVCMDSNHHFYIGVSTENLGLWICHKCNESGNWNKLRRIYLGNEAGIIVEAPFKKVENSRNDLIPHIKLCHKQLMGDKITLEWLFARNISVDSIIKYQLGKVTKKHKDTEIEYLVIPHFYKNSLMNIKFRSLPPSKKEFHRLVNSASILYNYDNIDHTKEYIYVTEGELDAVSLAQAGEVNVVGLTVGANSFSPDWYDLLQDFKIIYIVLDNDIPGQQGANTLADRLGRDRCLNVLLPNTDDIKDVNDYFKHFDFEDFKSLSLRATKFTIKTVYSLENIFVEMIQQLDNGKELIDGIRTPWETLNSKMGVIANGDLVYLTGRPKTAKTNFALNMCYDLSYRHNVPSLLFCLEMPPRRLAARLIALHRKVEQHSILRDDIVMTRTNLSDVSMYFGYTADPKLLNADSLFKIFKEIKQKYGIEFLVFDNLQFLSRSIAHTSQEVAQISRQFKLMAMNFDMKIMVIVQPRKMQDNEIMTSTHMKDSSSMEADADTVLILHRPLLPKNPLSADKRDSDDMLSPIITVTVDRTRYSQGGYTKLYLDGAKSLLRELTIEEMHQFTFENGE